MNNQNLKHYEWVTNYLGLDKLDILEKIDVDGYSVILMLYLDRYDIVKDPAHIAKSLDKLLQTITNSKFMDDNLKPYIDKIKKLEGENSRLLEALTSGEEYIDSLENTND